MAKITIIDGNNEVELSTAPKENIKAYMVKGEPGTDGTSPTASVSKTGDTATITITDKNGTTEADVIDGFDPTVTTSKTNKITTLTITDINGTRTAEILDGIDLTGGVPTNGVIGFDGTAENIPGGYVVTDDPFPGSTGGGIIALKSITTAPSTFSKDDKYYNSTDDLIYTATSSSAWNNGETPDAVTLYLNEADNKLYRYYNNTMNLAEGGGETLKIGTILPFSGGTLPTGYLFCDGSAISRTTYAGLFNVIGTSFGAGDGSTTFNLPNLKGKVPVGLDSSDSDFDAIGETGGEKTHILTQSELPDYNLKGLRWSNSGGPITLDSGSYTPGYNLSYGYSGVNQGQINNIIINSGGSNTPHNNLQPYVVVNYIIKASQTTPVQAQIVDSYSTSTTDGYSANYVNKINSGMAEFLLPAISANNSSAETSITSYTIPEKGTYLITGYGQPNLYGASSRDLSLWIRKNNSTAIVYLPFVINQSAYTVSTSFSAIASFEKNDVVNFNIKSSTTDAWAFNGGKAQIIRLI